MSDDRYEITSEAVEQANRSEARLGEKLMDLAECLAKSRGSQNGKLILIDAIDVAGAENQLLSFEKLIGHICDLEKYAPSWKPKPDAPGRWLYRFGAHVLRVLYVCEADFEWCGKLSNRWYGPIPDDTGEQT